MRKNTEGTRKKVKIGARYILLSLLTSLLFAAGIIGNVVPELFEFAGDGVVAALSEYWLFLIVAGLIVGAGNTYLTFIPSRKKQDERSGSVVQKG